MSAPEVVVVGGGLAGISAAAALRGAGCAVRVLEREPAAGGRTRGSEREGFRLDAAPFLVSARERRLAGLIADAGLAGRLLPLRPVTIAQARGGRVEETPPPGRPGEVARVGGVRWLEALRLRRLGRLERRFAALLEPSLPERAARLDDRSAADFVRLYFGASVWERWAEPWLASDLLAEGAEASRAAFLLARAARGEAPLATLRGSPAAIAEALWSDGDRLDCEVLAVAREGKSYGVATRDGGTLRADAVVLALPARSTQCMASELLTPAEHDGFAAARTVPAVVLQAALERSPTRKATRIRVPSVEGTPVASMAVEPGGAGAPAPAGAALLAVVAAPEWSRAHLQAADGVVEKELLAAAERLLPGATSGLRFTALRRYPEALPRFDVGRYRALARLRAVQTDLRARGRRLYFAGDHWAAPTLEGAIASGQRAAAELSADFRVPGPTTLP